jgi:hypothetical protein
MFGFSLEWNLSSSFVWQHSFVCKQKNSSEKSGTKPNCWWVWMKIYWSNCNHDLSQLRINLLRSQTSLHFNAHHQFSTSKLRLWLDISSNGAQINWELNVQSWFAQQVNYSKCLSTFMAGICHWKFDLLLGKIIHNHR